MSDSEQAVPSDDLASQSPATSDVVKPAATDSNAVVDVATPQEKLDVKPGEEPDKGSGTEPDESKVADKTTEETSNKSTETPKETKSRRRRRRRRRRRENRRQKENTEPANKVDAPEKASSEEKFVLQPVNGRRNGQSAPARDRDQTATKNRRCGARRGRGRGGGRGRHYPPHQGYWGRGARGPPPGPRHHYVPCDYAAVQRQLEFYFGETNLARDQYLRSCMNKEGWVAAGVLATFPRMRNGHIQPIEILRAAVNSPMLEVDRIFIRSRRLWKRFANASVQATAIQGIQRAIEVGTEVRPDGDDIPEAFKNVKCIVKKKIDNGRKSLISRADDHERCVIVLSKQLSEWSLTQPSGTTQ